LILVPDTSYELDQNSDGTTVTFRWTGDQPVSNGDIFALMEEVSDVDVDLNATTPDENCDVVVTATVENNDVDQIVVVEADWNYEMIDDDSFRLLGVVSGDARAEVEVRVLVRYGAEWQTVEKEFSVRCETGSGGITF